MSISVSVPPRQRSVRWAVDPPRGAETITSSTLALVGGAGRYNQDDIIARFGDETATPEERTSERIRRAEAIVEEDPDRAWETIVRISALQIILPSLGPRPAARRPPARTERECPRA